MAEDLRRAGRPRRLILSASPGLLMLRFVLPREGGGRVHRMQSARGPIGAAGARQLHGFRLKAWPWAKRRFEDPASSFPASSTRACSVATAECAPPRRPRGGTHRKLHALRLLIGTRTSISPPPRATWSRACSPSPRKTWGQAPATWPCPHAGNGVQPAAPRRGELPVLPSYACNTRSHDGGSDRSAADGKLRRCWYPARADHPSCSRSSASSWASSPAAFRSPSSASPPVKPARLRPAAGGHYPQPPATWAKSSGTCGQRKPHHPRAKHRAFLHASA